ncbi:hypothetical protein BG011_010230 [Mortierella polycephala]|uniref:Uncharacterized protein n=1 Tax=Mortierella polycephala TaxID=41804 RepID=A0A9P6TVM0_9FUNG|nr:hypothetical protein BG011_010230 [Mortierella polycephala]
MVTTRSRGIKPVPGLDATKETATTQLKRKNSTSAAPTNKIQKTDLGVDANAEAEAPFTPAPTPNSASANSSRQQLQSMGNVNGTAVPDPVHTKTQPPAMTSTTEKLEAVKEPEPESAHLPDMATVLNEPAPAVPITASTDAATTAMNNGTPTTGNAAPQTSVLPAPMAPEQPSVPVLAPATAPLSAAASVAAPAAAPTMPVPVSSTYSVTEPAIAPSTDTTQQQLAADSLLTSSNNAGTTYTHISANQPLGSDTVNKTFTSGFEPPLPSSVSVSNSMTSMLAGIEAAVAAANEAANTPGGTDFAAPPNPPSNSK